MTVREQLVADLRSWADDLQAELNGEQRLTWEVNGESFNWGIRVLTQAAEILETTE